MLEELALFVLILRVTNLLAERAIFLLKQKTFTQGVGAIIGFGLLLGYRQTLCGLAILFALFAAFVSERQPPAVTAVVAAAVMMGAGLAQQR